MYNATPKFKEPTLVCTILIKMCGKYLLPVDILHFWDCLSHITKNHRAVSLSLRPDGLLKCVTYVTWHNK